MAEIEIWHQACKTCHPDLDMTICGAKVQLDDGDRIEDGTVTEGMDCVVCENMDCPTCPEPEEFEVNAHVSSN